MLEKVDPHLACLRLVLGALAVAKRFLPFLMCTCHSPAASDQKKALPFVVGIPVRARCCPTVDSARLMTWPSGKMHLQGSESSSVGATESLLLNSFSHAGLPATSRQPWCSAWSKPVNKLGWLRESTMSSMGAAVPPWNLELPVGSVATMPLVDTKKNYTHNKLANTHQNNNKRTPRTLDLAEALA